MSDSKAEMTKKKETIAQLMEKWGGRYSKELGIDIESHLLQCQELSVFFFAVNLRSAAFICVREPQPTQKISFAH